MIHIFKEWTKLQIQFIGAANLFSVLNSVETILASKLPPLPQHRQD